MKSIFIILCCIMVSIPCMAQPGRLDATFGASGIVITPGATFSAHKLLLQPDGKIIAVGSERLNITHNLIYAIDDYLTSTEVIKVVRYNGNGSPDPTFGSGGVVEFISGTSIAYEYPVSAALQPDGKILLSCTLLNSDSNFDFALYRLNTDGSRDSAFGKEGLVTAGFDTLHDIASDIAVMPDGHILQCGNTTRSGNQNLYSYLMLVRYTPDGRLDSTFGVNGIRDTAINIQYVEKIQLMPSGKMLISSPDYYPIEFNADGTLNRVLFTPVPVYVLFKTTAIALDNSVIAGGDYGSSRPGPFHLMKFKPNATIDSSFGSTGNISVPLLPSGSLLKDIAVQTDGKILALALIYYYDTTIATPLYEYSNASTAVVRFLPNGNIDSTFGINGAFIMDTLLVNGQNSSAMILQPDGKILVLGNGHTTGQSGFVVLRLLNDLNIGLVDFEAKHEPTTIYPNPIHGNATLSYELTGDETISVSLYDMTGRKVQDISHDEYRQTGKNTQTISIGDNISAGNYILRMENGAGGTSSVKIVIR